MNISFEQFHRMWDKYCVNHMGLSSDDLPDYIAIDDYWYEGITQQEAKAALVEMEHEMRQELHFDT